MAASKNWWPILRRSSIDSRTSRRRWLKPEAERNQAAFEKAFFEAVINGRDALLEMLRGKPVVMESLDPQMRDRFVGRSGRIATMIFPKEEVWDIAFLDQFVGEVEQAASDVFGPDEGPETNHGVWRRLPDDHPNDS